MPEHKPTEHILNELNSITDIISRAGSIENMPAIEREIVLSKLRKIYEDLTGTGREPGTTEDDGEQAKESTVVEQGTDNNETLELEETTDEDQPEESSGEIEQEPEAEESPAKSEAPEDQPAESIPVEPEKADKPEETEEKTAEQQPHDKKKSGPGIIAEKLTGDKQFIYDTLAEKSSQDNLSTKLQSKPITDISAEIGINDKFKLIRDLFNGDSANFKKTVDILNSATNFNEAFTYINENFDWDMEDPSVQLILDLVRRKFIVKKDE